MIFVPLEGARCPGRGSYLNAEGEFLTINHLLTARVDNNVRFICNAIIFR